MSKFKKIAVVYGGSSSEAEVSKNTGKSVFKAVQSLGYDAEIIEFSSKLPEQLTSQNFDCVYNAMHGLYGEDGALQGMCEVMQIPYTHSGVQASAVAMNKNFTKNILLMRNIPMPGDYLMSKEDLFERELPIPCVIKPLCDGSSLGITILKDDGNEEQDIDVGDNEKFLVEDFIEGRELTVAVLNGEALGVLEIKPESGVYDYKSKYTKGATEYFCPAFLPPEITEKALKFARTAHNELGCKGVTRSDFIYKEDGEDSQVYFLEINTHPGMTETSLVPKIAKAKGLSFEDLVEDIINSASLELNK